MSTTVPIETAERDLKSLLEELDLGETVTLVDSEGAAMAVLISLKPIPVHPQSISEWQAEWEALAQEISQAWQGEQSAVETLSEMRR